MKQLRLDKQVLEAHEAATSALKACRETQGLTVERVEDTLDALAEVRRRPPAGRLETWYLKYSRRHGCLPEAAFVVRGWVDR